MAAVKVNGIVVIICTCLMTFIYTCVIFISMLKKNFVYNLIESPVKICREHKILFHARLLHN